MPAIQGCTGRVKRLGSNLNVHLFTELHSVLGKARQSVVQELYNSQATETSPQAKTAKSRIKKCNQAFSR